MKKAASSHTPVTTLREKQRQEREKLIIDVAEEVLLEKGYYETSMDEIASRVGIAKGTIYIHFPCKEDLVAAVFERNMRTFLEQVDEIIQGQGTPRKKLEALLQTVYTGFFSKQAQLLSSMYNAIDLKRALENKGGSMKELWNALVIRVTALLEEGKAAGELDPNIPTSAMVYSFFTLFSPRVYERMVLGNAMSHEELIACLQNIYFNGIARR